MRRIQVLALLFVAAFCMSVTPVTAHDIEVEYSGKTIYYTFINDNTELEVSYRGMSYYTYSDEYTGNVIIPHIVNFNGKKYPVTSIGSSAFQSCSSLTSVTIPNSVTRIGGFAFSYCNSLTAVTIGSGVTSIGKYAFSFCSSLTSITIDANNTIFDSRNNCNAIIKTSTNELIIGCANTIIPNSVTSIGSFAFFSCNSLTAVTIPNSVTSIGEYAFAGCTGLAAVTIPNSVTRIGTNAFQGCSSLTAVTISNSVTSIGHGAFDGCSGLTAVTIPNSVTRIEGYAFRGCSSLTAVTIPNSVTSIGEYAFDGCSGLTAVTISNSVTSIGHGAFDGCSGLTSITIPNSVASIGNSAFSNCSSLTSISIDANNTIFDSRNNCNAIIKTSTNELIQGCANTIIPNSVTSIGHSAFYGCSGLTSVTIPNSVTSIGVYAFSQCISLTAVTIPNSVTSIGHSAFQNCSSLTSVTIPNSVTRIGEAAFSNCSSLTSISIDANNTIYDSRNNCNAIIITSTNELIQGCANTIIPNSVTSIGGYAFYGCSSLTSVTIPNSVTSIGEFAFHDCRNLTEMYCYAKQVPTTGNNVFYEVDLTNATLHVPASALNDYKTTVPWSEFGIIVPIDEEEVDDLQDYLNSFADTEDVLTATTYTRQFKNTQWQSLYVPFSLSYDQWSPYFEVARLTGASITDDHAQIEATLLTADDGDLLANTPYLVRAKKTGEHTISFGASQLSEQKENTQALGELLTIKGVNSQRTGLKSSGFRCMIGGSLCYPSTDDYVLPPFRWYAYSNGPRMVLNSPVLVVIHDGTTTGITAKADAGDEDDRHAIYDLSGRSLTAGHPSELPKGIYLIDGKKCFVK